MPINPIELPPLLHYKICLLRPAGWLCATLQLREALTRAEADREEAENRHRTWMRQAQARQTELEGTAAQLAEALAEANRRSSVVDGVDGEVTNSR